jgi:transcriptional regulator of acetoin/glycerol metabolism
MVEITANDGALTMVTAGVVPLGELVKGYTLAALEANGMDFTLTALQLGMDRSALYRRVRRWRKGWEPEGGRLTRSPEVTRSGPARGE